MTTATRRTAARVPSGAVRLLRERIRCRQRRQRHDLLSWCQTELRLPAKTGPTPGRYDLARYGYCREILQAADDPTVEQIVLQMATQVGKTQLLQAILAGLAVVNPAPAMLCAPDRDATRELRDRFYLLCEATPDLSGRIPPAHLRNEQWIDFGDSLCHLAWSGSAQRISGKSCRVVLVTETDRARKQTHEGAFFANIANRVKAWHNFLILYESTPTDDSSAIARLYDETDRRRYWVPCPHCGRYQPLNFFPETEGAYAGRGGVCGLKDADGNWLTPDAVLHTAWYCCLNGCRIETRQKTAMTARGVWCPAGCEVDAEGQLTGEPAVSARRRGYQLSSLYADAISFGRYAAEYLSARGEEKEYQNWINNWEGRRYRVRTKTPRGYELWRRLRGAHGRGVVPAWALFLTAGCDVHDDNARWIVRAWGEGGSSALVDWGVSPVAVTEEGHRRPGTQLAPLKGMVIERAWPVAGEANPIGLAELGVLKTGIDSGHEPLMVHNFARQFHPDAVLCVAGDTKPSDGVPWTFSIVEKNLRTGKKYPGGMRRWAINTDHFKTDLHARWSAPLDEPGWWLLTDAAWDQAKPYLQEVCNEGKITTRNKRGFPETRWQVLQSGLGNHFLDCEVYARALAEMVVGGDWQNLAGRFRRPPPKPPEPADAGSSAGFIRRPSGGFLKRR